MKNSPEMQENPVHFPGQEDSPGEGDKKQQLEMDVEQ